MKQKITARKLQAAETKNRIHETALNLMITYGLENISVRDICSAANVSTGTFYHYFSSKDEILTLTSVRLDETAYATFGSLDRKAPFERQFISMFTGQAQHVVTRGAKTTAHTLSVHLKRPELEIFTRNRPFYALICQLTREAQASGQVASEMTAEEICDMAQAMFRGLWIDWCSLDGSFDLIEKTSGYIGTLLKSFLK